MDSAPDPSSMPVAALLALLLCVIILNAFCAVAETAFASANKNKLKALVPEGSKKAKKLSRLLEDPDRFFSPIQILLKFAGFLTIAMIVAATVDAVAAVLAKAHVPSPVPIAILLMVLVLSYALLVLGELYPRRLALLYAERIAARVVRPVCALARVLSPFHFLVRKSVDFLMMITRQHTKVVSEEFSEDEVMSMLEVGKEKGALKEEGRKMITSIFAFDDKLAYEIMTPRTDVFTIDIDDPAEEYIDALMELRYSRIPVYENDSDNIIGILNIKDYLIKAREDGFDRVDIRLILRKPYFVPETKNIDALFLDLKNAKQQIAVLIDEYGGFSGIVTMEDIIEEVMGEIDDEYDEASVDVEMIGENTYMIGGQASLDDVNETIGLNLDSDTIETIGGFIINILGEIPDDDDSHERVVEYENCVFTIVSVKERRIEKVKLFVAQTAAESAAD